jgi:hypothetical protein
MARTFLLQILQGFLCCDSLGAEFVQLWHIPKELAPIPQKNEAGATFPLVFVVTH